MSADDQLLIEARERPRLVVVAAFAGALSLAGAIINGIGQRSQPKNSLAGLFYVHDHMLSQWASAILLALAALAIGVVLDFLYRAAKARRKQTPSAARILIFVGAIGFAVTSFAHQAVLSNVASAFVDHGTYTYTEYKHASGYSGLAIVLYVGLVSQIALAAAFVLVSLNTMRVGLLTRFMAYVGMFVGVLFVIPIAPPVIQAFWLFALAYLLSGRWQGGLPPAWRSGRAEPWPTPQEMRERRNAQRTGGGPGGRAGGRGGGERAPSGATKADREPAATGSHAQAPQRPGAARRKRKKRH